ncbi:26S proteasome regulatory subunit 4 homolog A (26S proteasome AAA-ATPase subunit RPT2a) (26S proteasome subunit 4 homolog A) (Protein HALTED ROOT) (Regulatory particle triple-A ATPase subunit 2a), partial [Durusdinium trenchii]
MVSVMKVEKAPLESYADIGGLEDQIQEIKEAVELPLAHPELYDDIGIKPPKGVILYGEPGTGKTLLAKAVANQTSATFLRVVGSELIQKYLGDGPKLVRELFRVADDLSPTIVFIDEIDAVGSKRYESSSGGTREIQRTMLELLNQLDGFDERGDVKVEKAPLESYADIGGLEDQIQEIKEAVELPLAHPELYDDIGIKPPKGVILYGEPGTGKTLLAKAVANQTSATFLRVVGSELIQKYLGDGPKLVRELFRVADDLSPTIVFIDEIDAVGSKRYESSSGGTREIQRTMLELLNQLDGFDERGDVKVIM